MQAMQAMQALLDATDKNTHFYGLKGMILHGKVISIHDGDTLRIAILDERGIVSKVTCRMYGYDSPELKKDKFANDAKEQLLAECTSNGALAQNTKLLKVHFLGHDKWGRELVTLHDEKGCINERLLKCQYNVRYLGGKKPIHETI